MLSYTRSDPDIPKTFVNLALDADNDDYYWDSESGKVYYLSLSNVEHPKVVFNSIDDFFNALNNSQNRAISTNL